MTRSMVILFEVKIELLCSWKSIFNNVHVKAYIYMHEFIHAKFILETIELFAGWGAFTVAYCEIHE